MCERFTPVASSIPKAHELAGIDGRRIFENAAREAQRLNHPLIGSEQLLTAIMHQEECLAAQVLREQGFDFAKFRGQKAPLNPSDFE